MPAGSPAGGIRARQKRKRRSGWRRLPRAVWHPVTTGRSFFDWLATNQNHFRNRSSIANVAVLYPQSTIAFYGSNGTRDRKLNGQVIDSIDYLEGLYAALLEGRFLFDFVHQENLSAATLRPYRALLIPNAALRQPACSR